MPPEPESFGDAAAPSASCTEPEGSPAEIAASDEPADGVAEVEPLGPGDGTALAPGAVALAAGVGAPVAAPGRGGVADAAVVRGRVVAVPDVVRGGVVTLVERGRGAAVVGFGAAVVGLGAGAGSAGWTEGALPEPNRNPTDDPGLGS